MGRRTKGGTNQLKIAIGSWWGLEDVGTWQFSSQVANKVVTYTKDPSVSMGCFKSTTSEDCDKQEKCRYVKGTCLPKEMSNTWPSIGAIVNSKFDGEPYRLTYFLVLTTKKNINNGCISILEYSSTAVVLFPSGYVRQKKKLDILSNTIPEAARQEFRNKLVALVKSKSMVVLCGHSMGCSLAQIFAVELIGMGLASNNVYVVGSGAYMWTAKPVVDMFVRTFDGRYQFFGSKIEMQEKLIDPFLVAGEIVGQGISGFPTTILEINNTTPAEVLQPSINHASIAGAQFLHSWMLYKEIIEDNIRSK